MDVFVCAASEMERKKAIVIVLLCTVILENICEGKIRGGQLLLPVSVNKKRILQRKQRHWDRARIGLLPQSCRITSLCSDG